MIVELLQLVGRIIETCDFQNIWSISKGRCSRIYPTNLIILRVLWSQLFQIVIVKFFTGNFNNFYLNLAKFDRIIVSFVFKFIIFEVYTC